MPFVGIFANCTAWLLYGTLTKDPYVYFSNILGLPLGLWMMLTSQKFAPETVRLRFCLVRGQRGGWMVCVIRRAGRGRPRPDSQGGVPHSKLCQKAPQHLLDQPPVHTTSRQQHIRNSNSLSATVSALRPLTLPLPVSLPAATTAVLPSPATDPEPRAQRVSVLCRLLPGGGSGQPHGRLCLP
jgi:hypothetical protein